jgi:CMP/dCMP kinase
MKPLQIAIDGPVASGKGDIASRLAKRFNLLYLYTGAMYRALALACIEKGILCKDENKVMNVLRDIAIKIIPPEKGDPYPYRVLLNSRDVSERIQKQDTAQGASDVGILPRVREWMVSVQQKLARGKAVVMEGRDIGLRVLPGAQLKIYLNATAEARARRRFKQWQEKGINKSYEETLEDTLLRDVQDTTRTVDPLQKLPDAWELDTTALSREEVVTAIEEELQRRKLI